MLHIHVGHQNGLGTNGQKQPRQHFPESETALQTQGYWNGVGVEEEAVFQQLAFIKDLCALLDLFGQ